MKFKDLSEKTILAGAVSTPALAADAKRYYGLFINDSANDMYLTVDGGAAAVHRGEFLEANGGHFEMSEAFSNLSIAAVSVICAAGDGTKAAGTLTFTGAVSDGETVTIGSDIYEFDTNGVVNGSNIAVDVSGGATAPAAVTALVAAITASATEAVSAADGTGDTVVVTADYAGVGSDAIYGTAVNTIATTETCANASWGAALLAGGVDGTKYLLVAYK